MTLGLRGPNPSDLRHQSHNLAQHPLFPKILQNELFEAKSAQEYDGMTSEAIFSMFERSTMIFLTLKTDIRGSSLRYFK